MKLIGKDSPARTTHCGQSNLVILSVDQLIPKMVSFFVHSGNADFDELYNLTSVEYRKRSAT